MITTTIPSATTAIAPEAADFPDWPLGWYALARSGDVGARPVGVELFGRRLVCYRTSDGRASAISAKCWHMGADLAAGEIVDDQIQCPFHGWRYDPSGRCTHVPSQHEIPAGARQRAYATAEQAGSVFVFPSARASFPLPFFEGVRPAELVAAPPFEFTVGCPWWLVGTNGFDLQHFSSAHDRRLIHDPIVSTPHPAARRIVATFEVTGRGWRDRLTRHLAGHRVTMHVTMWAGTLAFVMARFHNRTSSHNPPRTTSYGMTEIRPLGGDQQKSHVRVTIFRRRRPWLPWLDAIDVRIRSRFIRAFLQRDVLLMDGASYRHDRLIPADQVMSDYLRWLAQVSRGQAHFEEPP